MAKVKRAFWKILVATGFASCLAMLLQGCEKEESRPIMGEAPTIPERTVVTVTPTNPPPENPVVQGGCEAPPKAPVK